MSRTGLILLSTVLAIACSREPANLAGRVKAAMTSPQVIADWIIQGRNDFLLIDLRPASDFEAGHIPGAVHLDAADLDKPQVTASLPDYKKLVFYGAVQDPDPTRLYPAFARGLHVMILEHGYEGWQRNIMAVPEPDGSPEIAARIAVTKYFRGESALGTPKPLREIPAEKYIQPPTLPIQAQQKKSEGC